MREGEVPAMIVDRSREKLLNSIIYFAMNTRNCGKTKLLKLLFLLDFEHFRQTGRSVTGMKYFAWKLGPVPVDLYDEIEQPAPDFLEKITIECEHQYGYARPTEKIGARAAFDPGHFSRREMRILESIAEENREKTGADMIDLTHVENGAWFIVWNGGEGKNREIPFEMALKDAEREHVLTLMQESKEFRANFA